LKTVSDARCNHQLEPEGTAKNLSLECSVVTWSPRISGTRSLERRSKPPLRRWVSIGCRPPAPAEVPGPQRPCQVPGRARAARRRCRRQTRWCVPGPRRGNGPGCAWQGAGQGTSEPEGTSEKAYLASRSRLSSSAATSTKSLSSPTGMTA
jgi:hypothetical protein